ncbi:MAG TPA: NAD(P)/FAD-dependent oxidoreductase [Thermoanaerobaculia bacterium]|nr:NAD(P)/FAD-dependent oxidoreductase [Thermoanaerobaculia bacterium]
MTQTLGIEPRYDAVVVGARCAGAATARLLARQGLRVLAVERGRYGSDTLSTHALMRGAVLQLHRWGVLERVRAAGTPTVRTTAFHYRDDVVTVPIKARDGIDGLYAPRRSVLDALLVDAAVGSGVTVVHETRVRDLIRSADGRVRGVVVQRPGDEPTEVRAGIVIGADGRTSTVAQRVGAATLRQGSHASGVIYAYFRGLPREGYQFLYGPSVSAGTVESNDGQVCVFAAMSGERFLERERFDLERGFERVLRETSPALADEVAAASRASVLRGFPGEPGYFRQSWGPGWALVGDAGYFKDPITAHGITDALRDAELLARAVGAGTEAALVQYQRQRDELSLDLFAATDAIASYAWSMEEVQALHLRMSEAMGPEMEVIRAFDETPGAASKGRRAERAA